MTGALALAVVVFLAGVIYLFAIPGDTPQNQGNEDEPQCDGEFCFHTEWKEDDV